ncbi:hypothetical protein GSB9_00937 [Flavobacteriaceae bacterium GSB9]|nr:hypothetical protein GSB9_00937 [Flavobacteriaceae bacterium GSB9]
MKIIKAAFLCIAIISLTSCASGYKMISPETVNYVSAHETDNVKLQYKYDLLEKKYAKKEVKKGVKIVALKITNNSDRDLVFGKDAVLVYGNGSEIYVMDNEKAFKTLKQSVPTYLLYLLLTPVNLYTYQTNAYGVEETTSSTPIGLVVGPGITALNMIVAGSGNKKFKSEMLNYNINGTLIKKGETKYGLIGIKTDSFDALELKIK